MKIITFTFTSAWHVWRNMTFADIQFMYPRIGDVSAIEINADKESFPVVLVYIRTDGFMSYRFYYCMRNAKAAQTRMHNSGKVRTTILYDWS